MARTAFSIRFLLILTILTLVSSSALAQYGASLEGTVTDKSGAVVSGATVTVADQATGVSHSTVTSDAGFYRISALSPGRYRVDVDAAGFKKGTTADVQVSAESTRGLDVILTPGAAQETVTVTAEGAVLETENASVTGSIGARQVEELPTFGRDPYELLRLAPGVFGDGARGSDAKATFLPNTVGVGGSNNSLYQVENQPQISSNGQRVTENNFTIDGVDVNSLTNGGASVVTPSEESIAEIKVLSGTYSAEDGRNSGAQIKVISKTGTNRLHGGAFFKYDEPGLNAFNTFGGFQGNFLTRAPDVRVESKVRNYGGSIGGPILKNKLFFFFAYEGEHAFNKSFGINYIETPQYIQAVSAANPSGIAAQILATPGTSPRVVALLTPSCADINTPAGDCAVVSGGLDLGSPFPAGSAPGNPYLSLSNTGVGGSKLGGGLDGVPDATLAQLVYPVPRTGQQYNARVDWTINSQHTFSASTYITRSTSTNPPGTDQTSAPNRDVTNKPFSPAGTILWNWAVSATKLNEVRLNFSRFAFDEVANTKGIVNWGIPDVEIQDFLINGRRIWFGAPQGANTPGLIAQNTYGFGDIFSMARSKHSLKFGFQYRKEQNNNNEIGFARPLFTFSGLWNFANDAPIFEQNAVNPNTGNPDPAQRYFRTSYYGGFAQDDWKVRPNLTFNIGVRYEYYTPVSEPRGLLSNLILAGSGPTAIANATLITGKTVYSTPKTNFAPRFGFAWSPRQYEQKIVFRGGFGMYYDPVPEGVFDPARENPPFHALEDNCCGTAGAPFDGFGSPFDQNSSGQPLIIYSLGSSNSPLSYPGNPALGGGIGPNGFPANGGTAQVYFEPRNFRLPYVYGYSFEMQAELPAKTVFTLGYQGSDSHHLLRIFDANLVYDAPAGSTVQSNPSYFIKPDVTSNYNSLNARLERRFSNGVQAAAKYRWSKSLDEVSFGQPDSSVNETYPRDLRTEYGPSDFDATHFVVLSGIWDLPIFRGKKDGAARFLGGWQLSGIFTYHSGFPWTAVNNNCLQTPGQQFICPIRPVGYSGGAGTDYSNDTFLKPHGNFPGGGPNFFTLLPPGPPGVGRNTFRGPHYRSVDLTFGKNTPLPFLGEGGNLQIRMNVFNVFNNLNLSPFTFNTSSTVVQDQFFGTAGTTPALAGRVVDLQARITF
jgi:outer membrane receptor protein involved in Fe transport